MVHTIFDRLLEFIVFDRVSTADILRLLVNLPVNWFLWMYFKTTRPRRPVCSSSSDWLKKPCPTDWWKHVWIIFPTTHWQKVWKILAFWNILHTKIYKSILQSKDNQVLQPWDTSVCNWKISFCSCLLYLNLFYTYESEIRAARWDSGEYCQLTAPGYPVCSWALATFCAILFAWGSSGFSTILLPSKNMLVCY